ncbi:MAG: Asp-tRNA(Asn)/Glu-tRNA(Gln) amidotransferase subunit GatA, partial [Spirochaetes bacterium]|nr:Asp-tRNA(Asn)/Glu-tRNA(Gln) amidotransferase subunit GatA [Spirochaetota bacterium]
GYVSPYSSFVTKKILDAGAIIVGRTNMDEFAMGSSTENSAFFTTRNPKGRDRIPGGSSGGSAAAVSAHHASASLGSDTGGSIRQPAAFTGVVGLKPTYGLVSRNGLTAFGSSLDQIGPLTKSVTDAALMLSIIAGKDENDSTSIAIPSTDYTKALTGDIKGMRLGLPKEYFVKGLNDEVKTRIIEVTKAYEKLGAVITEISLPHTEYGVAVYYVIATAEASSNLARFDGVRYGRRAKDAKQLSDVYNRSRTEGFGDEVKRRILLGTYVLSSGYYDAYYMKALKVRTLIKQDFDNAFKQVDAIITPTTPTTAFKAGEKTANPIEMYLSDIYTITVNLAGVPGISVPCGTDIAGLPIGFQLIGKHFDEAAILRLAHAYETR